MTLTPAGEPSRAAQLLLAAAGLAAAALIAWMAVDILTGHALTLAFAGRPEREPGPAPQARPRKVVADDDAA